DASPASGDFAVLHDNARDLDTDFTKERKATIDDQSVKGDVRLKRGGNGGVIAIRGTRRGAVRQEWPMAWRITDYDRSGRSPAVIHVESAVPPGRGALI